jgi:hypothetical protein
MSIEPGENDTYPMRLSSISFYIPSSDVPKLTDVLFFHSFKKNILSVSYMKDAQRRVSLEGQ